MCTQHGHLTKAASQGLQSAHSTGDLTKAVPKGLQSAHNKGDLVKALAIAYKLSTFKQCRVASRRRSDRQHSGDGYSSSLLQGTQLITGTNQFPYKTFATSQAWKGACVLKKRSVVLRGVTGTGTARFPDAVHTTGGLSPAAHSRTRHTS